MSVGDVAGGPHAEMSVGAAEVAQGAPADIDGGAPEGVAPEGDELPGPVAEQAATSAPRTRSSAHGTARVRVRGMATG